MLLSILRKLNSLLDVGGAKFDFTFSPMSALEKK